MTDFPDLKLKAVVNFPARVLDGTGIDVVKSNGSYQFDLDFSDFAPPVGSVSDAANQNALLWNSVTGSYTLAPMALLAGGSLPDAPNDGLQYGRQSLGWTQIVIPAIPTPSASLPLVDGTATPGAAATYSRGDHVHPVTPNNFVQSGTGAVTRTMQDKAREIVSVLDFGAVANGSITVSGTGTDARAAFVAAAVLNTKVLVPPGNYRIGAGGLSLLTGEFVFMPGAIVCPDTGETVTFYNPVHAGRYRIFGNNGYVHGMRSVYPEWWGAVHDGTTDDAPAIIKAIECVEYSAGSAGGEYSLTFDKGVYAINAQVEFTPSATIQWRVRGAGAVLGTTLLAKSTFPAFGAVIVMKGSSGSSAPIADWQLSNLAIVQQTQGSGAAIGLHIGIGGATLSGYHCSVIEDVRVNGFDYNFYFRNTRLVEVRRCSAWPTDNSGNERAGATGYHITADASNFVGDLTFINSQVVGTAHNSGTPTGVGVALTNSGNSSVTISGIRFIGFIFYGAAIQCSATITGSSTLSDIWFTSGTQFEGASTGLTTGLGMEASGGTSKIFDIHVNDCYMSGYGFLNHIKALTPSSGEIRNLFITDNFMSNPNGGGAAIDLRGTGGANFAQISILGNQVRDSAAAAGDGIYIENVSMCTVNNNALVGTASGLTNFIKFNTGGNWLVAQGNNRNGLATNAVTNSTGAANTAIANNL